MTPRILELRNELRQLEAETFEIEDVDSLDQSLLVPSCSCTSCCSCTSTSSCSSTSCNG
jgi:hypothetical protein